MEKSFNSQGKVIYLDVKPDDLLLPELFHEVLPRFEDDIQYAFHSNLGSITVLNRMTGFGYRDVETGYRDPKGKFWLASGNCDVRLTDCKTVNEAILWIKKNSNSCRGV